MSIFLVYVVSLFQSSVDQRQDRKKKQYQQQLVKLCSYLTLALVSDQGITPWNTQTKGPIIIIVIKIIIIIIIVIIT